MKVENSPQLQLTPEEIVDIKKEMHMKGRAMRVDETLQQYNEEREKSWADLIGEKKEEEKAVSIESTIIDPTINKTEALVGKRELAGILNIKDRKDLFGWTASYELAKIAKNQGIDLVTLSREEYVNYAIQNSLKIDDDQLRMAPWQRTSTSVEALMRERKKIKQEFIDTDVDRTFHKFSEEIKQKAGESNRYIRERIRVRSGTKDKNSWLFFGINNGVAEGSVETYKAYISLKDLHSLTPDRYISFMETLRDSQYNGDIKIFQDLAEQGTLLNDQIVMHGRSEYDAKLALQIAEQFFGSELGQKGMGKDEVINGKDKSYSQILAKKIKDAVHQAS